MPNKIFLERDKDADKMDPLWGKTPVVHSGYEHIPYLRRESVMEILYKEMTSLSKYRPNEEIKDIKCIIDKISDL